MVSVKLVPQSKAKYSVFSSRPGKTKFPDFNIHLSMHQAWALWAQGNNKSSLKRRFGCLLESTLCRLVGEGRATAARTGTVMQVSLMDHLHHGNPSKNSTLLLGPTYPELHRKECESDFTKVAVEFWQS